ncbi:hypothetical protein QBC37DRAFT_394833 [Rhypophila decipiens]|uniref:Uncharacterized protein n=1 Tax=Rhypophila decipiens TaxID=261697 RepID=A0AAN6YMM1_9PEZI|nr:hypothetical protein QBC37DRAFT_394833 [Rhypophila decipiens]
MALCYTLRWMGRLELVGISHRGQPVRSNTITMAGHHDQTFYGVNLVCPPETSLRCHQFLWGMYGSSLTGIKSRWSWIMYMYGSWIVDPVSERMTMVENPCRCCEVWSMNINCTSHISSILGYFMIPTWSCSRKDQLPELDDRLMEDHLFHVPLSYTWETAKFGFGSTKVLFPVHVPCVRSRQAPRHFSGSTHHITSTYYTIYMLYAG